MSHKDNSDTRSTGEGGWFYAENELFSVFAPLIGADGVAVYMAMCRLIPLAAVDPDRQVTTRAVEEASTVSRSQADRKIKEIVRLGMVQAISQGRNRPSAYRLLSLRQLSLVGVMELRRRLSGVPQGDTDAAGQASDGDASLTPLASQGPHSGVIAHLSASAEAITFPDAPAASVEGGVPRRDTDAKVGRNEPGVPERGLGVPESGFGVPKKALGVPESGFVKEEKEEEEDKYPPTPQGGRGVSSERDRDQDRGKGKSKSKSKDSRLVLETVVVGAELVLPDPECRPGESRFPLNAGIAARWVLAQCGISHSRGMESTVVSQLSLAMIDRASVLLGNAQGMASQWAEYQKYVAAGELKFQWGAKAFFGEGYWRKPDTWPWKPEVQAGATYRDAAVGMNSAEAETEREQRIAARGLQVAEWIRANAKAIGELEVPPEAAAMLSVVCGHLESLAHHAIAGVAERELIRDSLQIEREMLEALETTVPAVAEVAADIRKRSAAAAVPMNPEQLHTMLRVRVSNMLGTPFLDIRTAPG
jgi:hypothetical protein